jgi:hypothetical protein
LRRVLEALDAQTLPKESWELLVIDNASEQRLIERWALSWHPRARHIREEELGLTPARLRGIKESNGNLLVFVDDDNLLAPDYLQTARALLTAHPYLGVIGAGILEPEFAVEPTPELTAYLSLLALRQVSEARWSNNANDFCAVPWGAGLCVRRQVAASYQQFVKRLDVVEILDRRGEWLFGDGDVAFSWASVARGQGFGVFPGLQLTHLIPAERLTQRYLLRLVYDATFSSDVVRYRRMGILPCHGGHKGEVYMRLLLRGMRRGLFAMRLGWAESRATDRAKEYIVQQRLRPRANSGDTAAL